MTNKRTSCYAVSLFLFLMPFITWAQTTTSCSTEYQIEMFGSASTGKYTPFWIVSNKYGAFPLDAVTGNASLRAGVFHDHSFRNGIYWNVGADMIATTPRYRHVYVQQLFASVQYKSLNLTVGSKENYSSLWDHALSSGDMVLSSNARPIPEINLSVPRFTPIPFTQGHIQFRGNMAHGQSFDSRYIQSFTKGESAYVKNILLHSKSVHIRILDPQNKIPLTAVIGLRHHAQWGGTSTDKKLGKQPQSFKNFARVFLGKGGGDDASVSDQVNVLGNHYGSYDIRFGYLNPAFDIHVYMQHYFDDKSGMELYNRPDGLYGFQLDLQNFPLISKIVAELLLTRHQSGPVHYIGYDHAIYPGYGGGNDNYYNNGEYTTGVSYFNRGLGSPLLSSPEYNENGILGFRNNRIRAFHLGLQGYLSKQVSYRILATSSEGWGTMNEPFLKKENNFLSATKISYCHPRLENWLLSAEVGADFGATYGNNVGISLSVMRRGK